MSQKETHYIPCPMRLGDTLLTLWKDTPPGSEHRILRRLLRAAGLNPDNLDERGNPRPMPEALEASQAKDPLDAGLPSPWVEGDIWQSKHGYIYQVEHLLPNGCALLLMVGPNTHKPMKQRPLPDGWHQVAPENRCKGCCHWANSDGDAIGYCSFRHFLTRDCAGCTAFVHKPLPTTTQPIYD